MIPAGSDLLTVALLVALEAMLSADNALVMAVIVLGLPRKMQKKALRQGLVGAFTFRIAATLLAVNLIRLVWVKLLGGLYLLYLTYSHFWGHADAADRRAANRARPMPCRRRRGCTTRSRWTTCVLSARGDPRASAPAEASVKNQPMNARESSIATCGPVLPP